MMIIIIIMRDWDSTFDFFIISLNFSILMFFIIIILLGFKLALAHWVGESDERKYN